jgi:hypothetical protein
VDEHAEQARLQQRRPAVAAARERQQQQSEEVVVHVQLVPVAAGGIMGYNIYIYIYIYT